MLKRQIPWFERTFPTGVDPRLAAEVVARVAGAPARFRDLASGLTDEQLRMRPAEGWSIQENIAHIADLDRILLIPRVKEFIAGATTLLAADVTNRTSNEADHNQREIADVLNDVQRSRAEMVELLDACPLDFFARTARHERLGVEMSLTDLCVFTAEHDDSHAARIRELRATMFSTGN